MQDQIEILNKISDIIFESADAEYDELVLSVDVYMEGGWTSTMLEQKQNGEVAYLSIPSLMRHDITLLSFDLHAAMKAHTGGNLKKYTIRIDRDGEATVDFEYHQAQD